MARIGLLDRDHGNPIAAALGRQPKIDDFRKLLAQQRNKHLIQGLAKDARLVRWPAGEGGEVNRLAPHGDGADLKDREGLYRIIIARMVAIGPLIGVFVEQHMALKHDLGLGRNHQGYGLGGDQLGLGAAQEASELILGQGVGHGRNGGEDGPRIGPKHGAGGQGLALA